MTNFNTNRHLTLKVLQLDFSLHSVTVFVTSTSSLSLSNFRPRSFSQQRAFEGSNLLMCVTQVVYIYIHTYRYKQPASL